MTKSEVTTAVFNGAPAWGALAWSKLMRRKVGKSQLQFIKTVSIYINLTQTVTNTGNVPSFHPTRRGYASAATVRRRRLVDKARLRRGRPVRSRRAPSSQPRVTRTVRLPLANTRSILNTLLYYWPTRSNSPTDEFLIASIPKRQRMIELRTRNLLRHSHGNSFVDLSVIVEKVDSITMTRG